MTASTIPSIGIDFGGTSIKMGVVKGAEVIAHAPSIATQEYGNPDQLIEAIAQFVNMLRLNHPEVQAIGMGMPGFVNFYQGTVYTLTNVPGWNNVPVKDMLQAACGLPVYVENDANCMAYAEWKLGAGRGAENMIFLTMGTGMGGGHDEREQTLNQLLVEMDGFSANEGVIVIAATNRKDILDPALLRPGRFDRQIHVGRPDVKGREEILKVHAKDKKLDASVNLKTVARSTAGFTGADLSNLLNEAAILAARADRPVLTMEDMNEALMKITAGPAKKSRVQTRKDLKETAVHEAGHAVAMYNLPTHDPVRQITIVPRGQSLGATWYLPKDDSSNLTRNEMYEQIVSLLGGRVAEALFLGDISVGASNDIDRATKLAKDMVARYGMCEKLGTVSYLDGGEVFIGRDYQTTKSYSEKVAGTIDDEVRALIDKAYDHCKQILTDNSDKLHKVVDFLLEKETMTGEQFEAIMQGREVGDASSTSMFDGFEDGKEKPETTEE